MEPKYIWHSEKDLFCAICGQGQRGMKVLGEVAHDKTCQNSYLPDTAICVDDFYRLAPGAGSWDHGKPQPLTGGGGGPESVWRQD